MNTPLIQQYYEKDWYYAIDEKNHVCTDWYRSRDKAIAALKRGDTHDMRFPAYVGDMKFIPD